MLGQQFGEALDALDADDAVELLTGVGEVFAQALVHRHAARRQFGIEHQLEQGVATAATGSCLGCGLEFAEIGDAGLDLAAHRALADVVAGTDGRAGRQGVRPKGRSALGLRQDQRGRIGRQLDAVLRVLQQGVVVAVVTDQHRAEHGLAIGGYHQSTVAGTGLVDETVTARAGCGAVGIADGADVDAEQLELGRHVGAVEGLVGFLGQLRGDTARHAVARCNQAEHAAVPAGALADGEDRRIRGAAFAVDHDAAARSDLQLRDMAEGVLRADAGGKHDQVGFEEFAVGEVHPPGVVLAGNDLLGGARQVHADAQRLDARLQCRTAFAVQLHRHQARGEFDDMGFQSERLQRVGCFQPEQTAANHHTANQGRRGCGTPVARCLRHR